MVQEAYLRTVSEVLRTLRVRPDQGLGASAVRAHRERFGANELPRGRGMSPLLIFLGRFREVLVLILIVAAGISVALGRFGDALIIAFAILLDASLGFAQVWRTERMLQKIKAHIQPEANVVRGGQWKRIPARELVVGDIIEVLAGQRMSADARVIESHGLRLQEAPLTGESDDVVKTATALHSRTPVSNRRNMLFMGTSIMDGSGRAVVVATGVRTEFGKIAQVLKTEKSPPSPLRRKLQRVGAQIGVAIVGAVGLLVITGLMLGQRFVDISLTAITLIVSAIPEDLTVILTIALTIGVARILRSKGAVRELSSGETLGAATVICTDKTGTLTQGIMQVEVLDFLQGTRLGSDSKPSEPLQKVALIGLALASDAHRIGFDNNKMPLYVGSATERSALAFVERAGLEQTTLREQWLKRDAISFNRQWKYRVSLHDHPTQSTRHLFVSGAPEVLLERSAMALNRASEPVELTSVKRYRLSQKMESLAASGKRLLAVAVRRNMLQVEITHDDVQELLFLGVLVIDDPVRPNVRQAISETLSAGVAVKLVTGDHLETARSVAREVGLTVSDNALSSEVLQRMSDAELQEAVDRIVVFARVTPLDKQRIVRALQAQGHVVAMTGDGINDAVALQSADIGVAMGSGKDIAKEAADLVLLDDSFITIVAAIREGRVVRDNIRKVIAFLLATNAAEVAIFFVSLVSSLPLPLLPAQILWINLVTDGTSDIALALEPQEAGVMRRRPEDPKASLLGGYMLYHIVFTGVIVTIFTMSLYWYLLRISAVDLAYARTMAFTFISMSSLLLVWSFRSLQASLLVRGIWGNPWVPISLILSAGLHLLALYVPSWQPFFGTVPLGVRDWALIIMLAVVTLLIVDMRKLFIKGNYAGKQHDKPSLQHTKLATDGV